MCLQLLQLSPSGYIYKWIACRSNKMHPDTHFANVSFPIAEFYYSWFYKVIHTILMHLLLSSCLIKIGNTSCAGLHKQENIKPKHNVCYSSSAWCRRHGNFKYTFTCMHHYSYIINTLYLWCGCCFHFWVNFFLKTSLRVLIKLHRRVTGKTVEKSVTSDKSTS